MKNQTVGKRVDPSRAITSVKDLLLPRLELGLQFATIPEKKCQQRMKNYLKRDAFYVLSGIPSIWERMRTIRITELFIRLNTKLDKSGRTSLARLADLGKVPASKWKSVLEHKVSRRQNNRMAKVLADAETLGLRFVVNPRSVDPSAEFIRGLSRLFALF